MTLSPITVVVSPTVLRSRLSAGPCLWAPVVATSLSSSSLSEGEGSVVSVGSLALQGAYMERSARMLMTMAYSCCVRNALRSPRLMLITTSEDRLAHWRKLARSLPRAASRTRSAFAFIVTVGEKGDGSRLGKESSQRKSSIFSPPPSSMPSSSSLLSFLAVALCLCTKMRGSGGSSRTMTQSSWGRAET